MQCSRCAAVLPAGSAFCPICGAPVAGPEPPPVQAALRRPAIITLFAVLQFLGAAGWLLLAAIIAVAAADSSEAPFVISVAAFAAAVGGLQAACGVGLWTLRPFGRILQLVFAGVGLLAFPVGTVIAILILAYLNKPGVKLLFSGRPAAAFTPEESAQIGAVARTSGAMVAVLVALIVIGGTAMLAVMAAIAVPGLLRARMSANEASAIAVLSTVTSTQIEYMSSCGNGAYAASFESLLAGVPGSSSAVADLGGSPTPPKFGFHYTLRSGGGGMPGPLDCRGRPTTTTWYATAIPQTYGTTGTRSFAATAEGVWANSTDAAPEEPFGPPAIRIR